MRYLGHQKTFEQARQAITHTSTVAKKRMGKTNKTDALDTMGLAILLHNGTLPKSWIPPGDLPNRRELLRTRTALRDLAHRSSTTSMPPSTAMACQQLASGS